MSALDDLLGRGGLKRYEDALAERDAAQAELDEVRRGWQKQTAEWAVARGLMAEEVRELRAEVARLTEALRTIDVLDGTDDDGVYDEWGEAHCFRKAQEIARAALSPASTTRRTKGGWGTSATNTLNPIDYVASPGVSLHVPDPEAPASTESEPWVARQVPNNTTNVNGAPETEGR